MSDIKFIKPKIKEKCPYCKAKWKGDGWTQNCPSCSRGLGNR